MAVTDSMGAVEIKKTNFRPDKIGKNIEERGDLILTPMLSGDVEKVKFNYLLLRRSFPGMEGHWRISGKMENIYDETFEHIELDFRVFDYDHKYLGNYTILNSFLNPDEIWKFSLFIYEDLDIHNFKIHVNILED